MLNILKNYKIVMLLVCSILVLTLGITFLTTGQRKDSEATGFSYTVYMHAYVVKNGQYTTTNLNRFIEWRGSLLGYIVDSADLAAAQAFSNETTETYSKLSSSSFAKPLSVTVSYTATLTSTTGVYYCFTLSDAEGKKESDYVGMSYLPADSNGYASHHGQTFLPVSASNPFVTKVEHISILAKPQSFTVTYDVNGGAGKNTSRSFTYGDNLPSTVPDKPTRTGYTFLGYEDASGNLYFDKDGRAVSGKWWDKGENFTLTAQWQEHRYDISFDPNNGVVPTGLTKATGTMSGVGSTGSTTDGWLYDDTYTLPACTFERKGYAFLGWSTKATATTATYADEASVSCLGGGSTDNDMVTLYAIWRENTYTINFYLNGSATSPTQTITIPYETSKYILTFDGTYPQMQVQAGKLSSSSWTYEAATNFTTFVGSNFSNPGYLFTHWKTSGETTDGNHLIGETYYRYIPKNGTSLKVVAQWDEAWTNAAVAPSGSGTSASPYLIASAGNLAWMAQQSQSSSLTGYFKQTANINLSDKKWVPIGKDSTSNFGGTYDGNGYVIFNMTTTNATNKDGAYLYSYQGLFGYAKTAKIVNTKIYGAVVYGHDKVGILAGTIDRVTQVSACQTKGNVYSTGTYSGGLCGDMSDASSVTKSMSSASINGAGRVGGLVGYAGSVTISECGFTGSVSGNADSFALFIGYASKDYSAGPTISDCLAYASGSTVFYRGSGVNQISSCLFSSGSTKKYYDGEFGGWVKTSNSNPLPKGLSWLAAGSGGVTAKADIIDGYTKVS